MGEEHGKGCNGDRHRPADEDCERGDSGSRPHDSYPVDEQHHQHRYHECRKARVQHSSREVDERPLEVERLDVFPGCPELRERPFDLLEHVECCAGQLVAVSRP
ncbi:MAG: hypothetical protein ABEJ35_05875 [Halobacteriaceae archaeon]